MLALAKKKTQWMEDLYLAMKFAWQMLSKNCTENTPTTGRLLNSTSILNSFRKLQLFRQWDKGMDIHHKDETSYTTQYQEGILKYVENQYCAKHRRLSVIKPKSIHSNNLFPSAIASGSSESLFETYHSSSDDEGYLMPENMAEMTAGLSNFAARLFTASRLYLNSPPESPKNWGQVDPNLND